MSGIKTVQIIVRADGSTEPLGHGDRIQTGYEWNGQAYPTQDDAQRAKARDHDHAMLRRVFQELLDEPDIDSDHPPARLPQSYDLTEQLLASPRLRERFMQSLRKIAQRPTETYADLRGND